MVLDFDDFNKNLLLSCGKSLLDVGCGTGRFYEWKQKHSDIISGDYVGVDVDPEVIKKAILKYKSLPDFNPEVFKLVDGKDLSIFPDKSFDTILMIEVIEHVNNLTELEVLIKECIRIARKNIMITTPNCSDEEMLRKHGLIYVHYTHSIGSGYEFKIDSSHQHHLRFTRKSLSNFLSKICNKFDVIEKKPIEILKQTCYYKLWAEIYA